MLSTLMAFSVDAPTRTHSAEMVEFVLRDVEEQREMVYDLLRDGREEDVMALLRDAGRGFYFREQDEGIGQIYGMPRYFLSPLVWYAKQLIDAEAYPVLTEAIIAVLRRFVRETPLAFFEGRWSANFFGMIQRRPIVMAHVFASASVEKLLATPRPVGAHGIRDRSLWEYIVRQASTEAGGDEAREFATVLIETARRVPHLVLSDALPIYMIRAGHRTDPGVVYALIGAAGDHIPEPYDREVDMAHAELVYHALQTQNLRCVQAIVSILKDPEIADSLQQAESDLDDFVQTVNPTRHTSEAIRFHQHVIDIMRGVSQYTGLTKGAM